MGNRQASHADDPSAFGDPDDFGGSGDFGDPDDLSDFGGSGDFGGPDGLSAFGGSGDDLLPPPAGGIPASPEDARPEVAKLLQLLALAGENAPGSEQRVEAISQMFELLLEPAWVALLATAPKLREAAIAKAYEFSEIPALSWAAQSFLMTYHPEALCSGEGAWALPAGGPRVPEGHNSPGGAPANPGD